jgi:hypothetical protein
MKLTPQRARELRRQGVEISPDQIIRPKVAGIFGVPKVEVQKIEVQPVKESIATIEHLVNIMEISAENMREVIRLNEKIVEKITESKQLKKWRCSVGRSGGDISTIDINEV